MTQGKATATVSGRTIAETDEYEVVEGNIYVCCILTPTIDIC
jgi:glutamine cyclotransferase